MSIVTLAERKAQGASRLRENFGTLYFELATYGAAHSGRFWIYGSAARGELRWDSDIDILAEFPEAAASEAVDFAEAAGARLELEIDAQPLFWCKPAFLEKIKPTVRFAP